MSYADRLEQMPLAIRMFAVFLWCAAVVIAALFGMILFLVIFKIVVVGVC